MLDVRPAAVAGVFYPDDPGALRTLVTDLLRAVPLSGPVPKALVAPHAGYAYSGPVAARAYAQIAPARERVTRVVVLGPAHHVPFAGVASSSAARFATPLGEVTLDPETAGRLHDLPQVRVLDAAHAREHSLEVQLPFLQVVLGEFRLVPLLVGEAGTHEVGEVLDRVWGGPETVIVVSSDLSHFHDHATARRLDAATSRAIRALRAGDIHDRDACGCVALRGLLDAAGRRGMRCTELEVLNSGDTTGRRDRVVGYGAYAFREAVGSGP